MVVDLIFIFPNSFYLFLTAEDAKIIIYICIFCGLFFLQIIYDPFYPVNDFGYIEIN